MRLDVLEAFAEATPGGVKLGKLAQLPSSFDGDRPRLDGIGFGLKDPKPQRDPLLVRLQQLRSYRRKPDLYRAKARAYRAANPEATRAAARAWRRRNADLLTAAKMRWIAANREHVNAVRRAYYAANKEKIQAATRARPSKSGHSDPTCGIRPGPNRAIRCSSTLRVASPG